MKKILLSNVFYSLLIIGCGLIGSVILSRELGPEDRGELAAIILYPGLLVYLGSFGTYSSVIFYLSKVKRRVDSLWGSCLIITGINSLISIPIGGLLIYFTLNSLDISHKVFSFIFLLFLPFMMTSQFISSILQARGYFKYYNYIRLFTPLSYLIAVMSLFLFDSLNIVTAVISQISITVLQFMVFSILFHKLILPVNVLFFKLKTIKVLYGYGFKVWLGDLSQGLNMKTDQIIISSLLLSKDLGFYVVAVSVANFSTVLSNAIKTIYLPLIAAQRLLKDKLTIASKMLKKFALLNLVVIVACIVAVPIAIPLVFGEEFYNSVLIAQILLVGYLFFNSKIVLTSVMQGIGKPITVSYSEICGLVVLALCVYPLITQYKLIGAACAVSLGYMAQSISLFVLYLRSKNNAT